MGKKKQQDNSNYLTNWQNYFNQGDLDRVYQADEIISLCTSGEVYYYKEKPDDLVLVDINEKARKILVCKRGNITPAQKALIQPMIGHLQHGKHLMSVSNESLVMLSDLGDFSYTNDNFSWKPRYDIYFGKDWGESEILVKVTTFKDAKNFVDKFIMTTKLRVTTFAMVEAIKQELVCLPEKVTEEGIGFFLDSYAFLNDIEVPSKYSKEQIFKAIQEKKLIPHPYSSYDSAQESLIGNKNAGKLIEVVTEAEFEKPKEEEDEEDSEGLLAEVQKILQKSSNRKTSLKDIIDSGDIPSGKGTVNIDTPNDFYPKVMSKIEKIFYNDKTLIINLKRSGRGTTIQNIADVFDLKRNQISLFVPRKN